jgi:bacterioferritin-associated ferredoxin
MVTAIQHQCVCHPEQKAAPSYQGMTDLIDFRTACLTRARTYTQTNMTLPTGGAGGECLCQTPEVLEPEESMQGFEG